MTSSTRDRLDERPGEVTGDEPVDGLDGGVEMRPGELFGRVYAFFYSKRTGLGLILALGFFCLLGVLFDQAPDGVRADPASYTGWLEQASEKYGGWTSALSVLGVFGMFDSWPFRITTVALALSILACSFHRLPRINRHSLHPYTHVTADFFSKSRLQATRASPVAPDAAAQRVRAALAKQRFRVLEDDRGPGLNLYADKNRFAPYGTIVAHFAFVIIIIGVLVTSTMGFKDEQFTVTVGSTAEVGHDTGLSVEARSFTDSYYDNGTPKDYVSDLVVYRDGQQVAQQEVRVNDPLSYNGVTFYQSYFGIAAMLEIRDVAGNVLFNDGVPLQWTTGDNQYTYGKFTLEGKDLLIYVVGVSSGQRDSSIGPGQVRVEVYPASSDTALGSSVLSQGVPTQIGELSYTFQRERQYTGLIVKQDRGAWIVWLGSLLIVLGTCYTMFFTHRRIWVRVTPTADGAQVQLAAPDRPDSMAAQKFNDLADAITQPDEGSEKRGG